jgi:phosphocarrier protein HPr
MQRSSIILENRIGLHSRLAVRIAEKASQYTCQISISKGSNKVDAKNAILLLSLEAGQRDTIEIEADGIDEKTALEGLMILIQKDFV